MKRSRKANRIDIGTIRRGQIVEAAVAVIAERGLQHLSLSEIEKKVGMSRGHLTYYFKTKEAILLAVFDRLLELMCQHHDQPAEGHARSQAGGWEDVVRRLMQAILEPAPHHPEFLCLQYTFLSQIGHRADFRERLARLYEEWREQMSLQLGDSVKHRPAARQVSPRALATLVQAILHGLAIQNAADPQAIDRQEIVDLCMDMLGTYVWNQAAATKKTARATRTARLQVNGVHHGRSQ
jgi:AcrR family transcriptional regulator